MGLGDGSQGADGWGSAGSSSTELQSWGTAELARSVRFRQGTGTDLRDDRLIHSRIHGDPDLGGAAFGDPRVGQGDPGGKPVRLFDKVMPGVSPGVSASRTAERCFSGLGVGTKG